MPLRPARTPLLWGVQAPPSHSKTVLRRRPIRDWRRCPRLREPCLVPLLWACQVLPFHFRIVPSSPTAHTLSVSVPQMPMSVCVVPLLWAFQAEPFHFRIAPFSPTTQTLLTSVPQTPYRLFPAPPACGDQAFTVPFHDRAATPNRPDIVNARPPHTVEILHMLWVYWLVPSSAIPLQDDAVVLIIMTYRPDIVDVCPRRP